MPQQELLIAQVNRSVQSAVLYACVEQRAPGEVLSQLRVYAARNRLAPAWSGYDIDLTRPYANRAGWREAQRRLEAGEATHLVIPNDGQIALTPTQRIPWEQWVRSYGITVHRAWAPTRPVPPASTPMEAC